MTNIDRKEIDLKARLINEFEFFVRYFFKHQFGRKFIMTPHFYSIIDALVSVVKGDIKRLIINIPPRYGKTAVAVKMFVAWVLANNPSAKFIHLSFSDDLALDNSSEIRELVKSEEYQRIFGVAIRTDSDSKKKWYTLSGGGLYATSTGGPITGFGAGAKTRERAGTNSPCDGFEGCIILDDPLKPDDAFSETMRNRINTRFNNTIASRVNSPTTPIIVIMQRLHECLLPGVMVRVPSGEAPIDSLKKNDYVYGSKGWQRIIATKTSEYSGISYGIRLYGSPTVCWTTDNHKYLTMRGWVRADEVLSNDWVRFPIARKTKNAGLNWPDVRMADPIKKPSGNFTGERRRSIDEGLLREMVSSKMPNVAIAKALGVHRNTINCYIHIYKIKRFVEKNSFNDDTHLCDPDFWRIVGYYLSEGSFCQNRDKTKCGVRFTFSHEEESVVQDLVSFFSKYGMTVKIQRKKKSVIEPHVFGGAFSDWLCENFGSGSFNKKLPEFVFSLDDDCKRELILGWLIGDGCIRKESNQLSGTSVSIAMLHGFQRLSLSMGKRCNIVSGRGRAFAVVIDGRQAISSGKGGELRFVNEDAMESMVKSRIDGDFCWYRVKKIDKKDYEGIVYDITTPSGDFVVGNATVHNSDMTGFLLEGGSGEDWHHVCLAAIKPDGTALWPEMHSIEKLRSMEQADPYTFAGQYMQIPSPLAGGIMKPDNITIIPALPMGIVEFVRGWDFAASTKGDFTAGAKLGVLPDGRWVIADMVRIRVSPDERDAALVNTANRDGDNCRISIPQDPGQAGLTQVKYLVRSLSGFSVKATPESGNKVVRAEPFAAQVNVGNVLMLKADWNDALISEMRMFPNGTFDDQVDALSRAFSMVITNESAQIFIPDVGKPINPLQARLLKEMPGLPNSVIDAIQIPSGMFCGNCSAYVAGQCADRGFLVGERDVGCDSFINK